MTSIQLTGSITAELNDLRLDQALAKLFPDYSRAQHQQWIKQEAVYVDQALNTSNRYRVREGQAVYVDAELQDQGSWQAQDIPLDVVYEDEDIIVINKPAGLVVHPGAGKPDGTLLNALLNFDETLLELPRAGIVHRLDKDTSGLLVVARNLASHHHLVNALAERIIKREYIAIVHGPFVAGGTIDAPIGRHPTQRTKMAVVKGGRISKTHYRILEKFERHTALSIELQSGRTHQIRVHMQHKNHPLIGDKTYNLPRFSKPAFHRQALHATRLSLHHPKTGEWMSWQVDMPEDMQELMVQLRNLP